MLRFTAMTGTREMVSAKEIIDLHDRQTRDWHGPDGRGEDPPERSATGGEWQTAVGRQHLANFELWHIEDEARAPGATDGEIAGVKRRIDGTNQRRNDLTEELDRVLLEWLASRELPRPSAALNSESPGLMIDRLSILALKIYHTGEEATRPGAPEGHAERNRQRLAVLEEQRADLAGCLDALWRETLAGERRFKIYRQLKMYNDPSLNPAIYGKTAARRRP
jgi:hypothetical protein